MENIHFGHKLKQAMDKSGLSRKEIANKGGISEANLYKMIHSDDIKTKTLLRLAKVLDVPLQYFFDIQDSERNEELRRTLDNEKMNNRLLEENIRSLNQQFGMLIGIIKDFEKESAGASGFLTLLNPDEQQKIPFSSFINIFHKMVASANKLPQKEEMYVKYTSKFLNIVEIRKAIVENIHLYSAEIQEIFSEIVPIKDQNEYIDFEKLWKNI